MSQPYINPDSLGEPTKVKMVKKINSGMYNHSHPFGGVEEALMFCDAEELYRTAVYFIIL